jgi:hypothetical protein
VVTRLRKVATYQVGLRFRQVALLGPSVNFDALLDALERRHRNRVAEIAGSQGQLPKDTAEAIGEALHRLDNDAGDAWDRAVELAQGSPQALWPDDGVPVLAYERDALGLSLAFTGIRREGPMGEWDGDTSVHYLEAVGGIRMSEDQAINQDAQIFGGDWLKVAPGPVAVRYEDGPRTLSVLLANRTDLEHTLGVDLLYYSHDVDSYVLAQYKKMRRAANRDWEFRPSNDRNFEGELDRMRAVAGGGVASKRPAGYRLGKNFCFIKFCEAETSDIASTQLTKGMTLPLDLWDSLVAAGELRGPQGGTVLRYDTAGRWLSNTTFIELVGRSWVGTSGISTRRVAAYVKKALGDGYAVMMAAGRTRT